MGGAPLGDDHTGTVNLTADLVDHRDPASAAALLRTAVANPERLTGEASFAALCGVSPIEASSPQAHRLRLNRGGDRQANSALCTTAVARLRCTKSPGLRPAARHRG